MIEVENAFSWKRFLVISTENAFNLTLTSYSNCIVQLNLFIVAPSKSGQLF